MFLYDKCVLLLSDITESSSTQIQTNIHDMSSYLCFGHVPVTQSAEGAAYTLQVRLGAALLSHLLVLLIHRHRHQPLQNLLHQVLQCYEGIERKEKKRYKQVMKLFPPPINLILI